MSPEQASRTLKCGSLSRRGQSKGGRERYRKWNAMHCNGTGGARAVAAVATATAAATAATAAAATTAAAAAAAAAAAVAPGALCQKHHPGEKAVGGTGTEEASEATTTGTVMTNAALSIQKVTQHCSSSTRLQFPHPDHALFRHRVPAYPRWQQRREHDAEFPDLSRPRRAARDDARVHARGPGEPKARYLPPPVDGGVKGLLWDVGAGGGGRGRRRRRRR